MKNLNLLILLLSMTTYAENYLSENEMQDEIYGDQIPLTDDLAAITENSEKDVSTRNAPESDLEEDTIDIIEEDPQTYDSRVNLPYDFMQRTGPSDQEVLDQDIHAQDLDQDSSLSPLALEQLSDQES